MLKQHYMQGYGDASPKYSQAPLQLLLFVDERPKSRQQVQQIRSYLKELGEKHFFELEIVDVGEQPYLAEHFKLVATPALIKIHPEPRQILAGNNIATQLKTWWSRWQSSIDSYLKLQEELSENIQSDGSYPVSSSSISSVAVSSEVIRLTDEIFSLKQEKEKLLKQLEFRERVIAMLAHDLRNPLTAVSIAIETLQSNYDDRIGEFQRLTPSMAKRLLSQARNQTQTIGRMITDLLEVGRGNDTRIPIAPQKIQIGQLCLKALNELSDRYHHKSLKIETDIPSDLPAVYADPERISQVLINLLDNAIKYTPSGGIITISGLHRTSQKIQLSIGDSGPGIPEENRDCIFENHFRLQRDQDQEGYGIGLSLCKRIVCAHYGQIWVETSPTKGAWFHFTLPVYKN